MDWLWLYKETRRAVYILGMIAAILLFTAIFMVKFVYAGELRDITVMEVDTGVDYLIPDIADHVPVEYQSVEYMDTNNHGTHVAGIILKDTCKQVKLIPCSYYEDGKGLPSKMADCFRKALSLDVDLVNVSGGGEVPYLDELNAAKSLQSRKIILVTAAGNNGKFVSVSNDVSKVAAYVSACDPATFDKKACVGDKHYYYPASYDFPNILRVASYHGNVREITSNYGDGFVRADGDDVLSYQIGGTKVTMSGTSQATALVTNRILREVCKIENNR